MSQPLKTLCLLLLLPLGAAASTLSISSSKIRFNADTATFFGYAQTAGPPALNLLYSAITSSHIVFNYNGITFDMQDSADSIPIPLHAVGSGLGAYIEGAKQEGNLVFVERFTIVNNPRTGLQPDTIQYTLSVTNTGSVSLPIGARLLMDLQVNGADYSPLSTNNGISTFSVNTLFRADSSGVPSDWWAYDIDPSLGTPTLTARGVTRNNPFDALATPPDAMEDVDWDDVENLPWDPEPNLGVPFSAYNYPDNCVVLWWTGSGQEGNSDTNPSITLGPGQTRNFITYFGLSQDKLKASPTPLRSPSPSPSATATFSATPTWTPSPTISPSFTPSPSFSVSPTLTPSFSSSPTFSFSPTASSSATQTQTHTFSPTPTPTASVTSSFSASPTFSVTPTLTRTPSFTFSPTSTASPSLTPSFTASPSYSQTPSVTQTYTITWTRTITPTYTPTPPTLLLSPKPPNPNPSNGNGVYLPYILTLNATVRIKVYTIAGELLRSLDPFSAKAGANEQFWNERNDSGALVASGIFIYRIEAIADDNESKSAFMKLAVVR